MATRQAQTDVQRVNATIHVQVSLAPTAKSVLGSKILSALENFVPDTLYVSTRGKKILFLRINISFLCSVEV